MKHNILKECEMRVDQSIVVGVITLLSTAVMGDIKPAGLFMDHMVIQRETQAPVWGTADAGEKVTVSGSCFKGKNVVELTNVLSGDVWLCSGQSNMYVPVRNAADAKADIAAANYPQIRSFTVANNPAKQEADDCGGEWRVCAPETVKKFSAVAYFTGRELHMNLEVPIGLLTTCWGGTDIEAWTPWSEQAEDSFARASKAGFDEKAKGYSPEKAQAEFESKVENWKKKKRGRKPKLQGDPRLEKNYPGNLYNGMIHPLAPFAVKGALWYQGENNAQDMEEAEHYRVQLARMVTSWRKAWDQDLPFYSVQLPNFREPQVNPVELDHAWAMIRESFVQAGKITPDVFTCTMIDLGEANNIHPRNKGDVGRRMASTILNKTYGKGTPTTPFMDAFTIEGDQVVITFDYTGSGLVTKGGGKLKTFAIAGADQKFVWADAEIVTRDGADCVVVSSSEVKEPVAVRYAWADNPAECNLFSKEGFPASPFRTDDWAVGNSE
jgi:sialate O-acetylesterase